jgi:hypothetical protein
MTLAVSQTATRVLTDAGGATTTISFASLPTAGHGVGLFIVDGVATNPTLDPSVADNQGVSNLYQKAKSAVDTSAGQLAGLWYCESIGATSGTFTATVTHAASSGNYSIIQMIEANGPFQLSGTPTSTNQTGGTGFTLTCPSFSGSDALLLTAMTVDSSTGSNNIANSSSFTNAMVEQDSTAHVVGSGDYKAVSATTNMVYTYAAGSTDAVGVMAAFIPRAVATTIQDVDYMRRNRPGRGPYSKGAYRRPSSDAYTDAVAPVVAVTPQPLEDTRRNRPGRGPYSYGAYFRPRIDAFTDTAQSTSISGTASVTLGALTLSATATLDIFGTLSQTLGALTTNTATGTVLDTGASAITLQSLSLSATGQLLIQGTLNQTLDSLGVSAQAGFDRTATLTVTLDSLAISAASALDITGTLSQTLADLTVSATNIEETSTARVGGDDASRPKHHAGWNKQRAQLKLKKEKDFADSIVGIYRELTQTPTTKDRAEEVVAPPVVKRNDESEAQYDRRKAERENAFREERIRQLDIDKEIALRMLHLELIELQHAEDEQAIEHLLAQVL